MKTETPTVKFVPFSHEHGIPFQSRGTIHVVFAICDKEVDKEGNLVFTENHYPYMCRDYLNTHGAMLIGKSEAKEGDIGRPLIKPFNEIDTLNISISVASGQSGRKQFFKNNFHLLNAIEKLAGVEDFSNYYFIDGDYSLQYGFFESCSKIVVEASSLWRSNIVLFSMFSLLLRTLFYDMKIKEGKDDLVEDFFSNVNNYINYSHTEGSYWKNIVTRIDVPFLIKNHKELFEGKGIHPNQDEYDKRSKSTVFKNNGSTNIILHVGDMLREIMSEDEAKYAHAPSHDTINFQFSFTNCGHYAGIYSFASHYSHFEANLNGFFKQLKEYIHYKDAFDDPNYDTNKLSRAELAQKRDLAAHNFKVNFNGACQQLTYGPKWMINYYVLKNKGKEKIIEQN